MKISNLFIVFILICTNVNAEGENKINYNNPVEVVKEYLKAKNWKERIPFILDSENLAKDLRKRYRGIDLNNSFEDIQHIFEPEPVKNRENYVRVEVDRKSDPTISVYYLKKDQGGYKIDWEPSVGYNREFNRILATESTDTEIFRLRVKLGRSFPSEKEFSNLNSTSFSMDTPCSGAVCSVVSPQNTNYGKKLYAIIDDGDFHEVTLKVRLISSGLAYNYFLVEDLVSDSWLY